MPIPTTSSRFRKLLRATASRIPRGFSLLELLVATVVLSLILVVLFSILDTTTTLWARGSSRIQSFQEARAAYEAVTRKLSQATLNIYWAYDTNSAGDPAGYRRKSELQFVSGPSDKLLSSPGTSRTHSVFFVSHLGYTTNAAYSTLQSTLNAGGYYIAFESDDDANRPAFISGSVGSRSRFRLKEVWQPTESLSLYSNAPTAALPGAWYSTNQSATLAENIIALVIRPRLPEREDPTGSALVTKPGFVYNSAASNNYTAVSSTGASITGNTLHQLPPLVQVTMVAIDEKSAARFANGQTPPDYGVTNWSQLFADPDPVQLAKDLQSLEAGLISNGITYQIFDSLVPIEGAKWSR